MTLSSLSKYRKSGDFPDKACLHCSDFSIEVRSFLPRCGVLLDKLRIFERHWNSLVQGCFELPREIPFRDGNEEFLLQMKNKRGKVVFIKNSQKSFGAF
jgi:hypothetical protein